MWCKYAELELGAANMPALKAIFQRCLMQVPSLELWALYIKFIRRSNKSERAAAWPAAWRGGLAGWGGLGCSGVEGSCLLTNRLLLTIN